MNCEYCGVEIKEHHPKMIYSKVTIAENPSNDKDFTKPVCQKCAKELIADLSRYQPGKLYIE